VTTGGVLAPGSYGDLHLPVFSGTLTLTSGNYYFTSFALDGAFTTLNFDLSKGPINVFVTGDVTFGDFLTITANGTPVFNPDGSPNTAVESLASKVFFETLGNGVLANPFGGPFFGTLEAPNGNIDTSFGAVIGSLLAGGEVTTGAFAPVYYVGSDRLLAAVPEPSTLVLGGIGAIAGLLYRRRQVAPAA
jgi:hypothetical protein